MKNLLTNEINNVFGGSLNICRCYNESHQQLTFSTINDIFYCQKTCCSTTSSHYTFDEYILTIASDGIGTGQELNHQTGFCQNKKAGSNLSLKPLLFFGLGTIIGMFIVNSRSK